MYMPVLVRSVVCAGIIWVLVCCAGSGQAHASADMPFIGEIACGGWNFCPNSWAECNGALIPISENEALFTLIGTTYGGDGQNTFALPNIQGRSMVHQGTGSTLSPRQIGEDGGVETVTLTGSQMPAHSHTVIVHTDSEKAASPTNRIPAVTSSTASGYAPVPANTQLASGAVIASGGSQPHNNLQPYQAVKCCISLFGIFPSPN